jgi:hypothetical protein
MNKKFRKLFAFANNHYAGHGASNGPPLPRAMGEAVSLRILTEFLMFVDFAQEYYTWTARIHALIESRVSCEGDSL